MNPFSRLWSAVSHLAEQIKRLADAFGAVADQIEGRALVIEHEPSEALNGRKRAALPAGKDNR